MNQCISPRLGYWRNKALHLGHPPPTCPSGGILLPLNHPTHCHRLPVIVPTDGDSSVGCLTQKASTLTVNHKAGHNCATWKCLGPLSITLSQTDAGWEGCTLPVSRAGQENQVVNTSLEQPLSNGRWELVYKYPQTHLLSIGRTLGCLLYHLPTSPAELSPNSHSSNVLNSVPLIDLLPFPLSFPVLPYHCFWDLLPDQLLDPTSLSQCWLLEETNLKCWIGQICVMLLQTLYLVGVNRP